jgi:hypothetical protein
MPLLCSEMPCIIPAIPRPLPAGKSRWRTTSPEDTSISPVPVTEAIAAAERNPVDVADWLY